MDSGPSHVTDLHREAVRRLRDRKAVLAEGTVKVDSHALDHKLQLHQIDLEMRNEELRFAQGAPQVVSDKYRDLFDFAPIGYFRLDGKGRILDVNLAGAALLGLERSTVLKQQFRQHVAPQSLARFAKFCDDVLRTDDRQTCEVELLRGDQRAHALLEGIRARGGEAIRSFLVTVTDVTDRKRIEDAKLFLLQSSSKGSGEEFFQALAKYLAQSLGMDYVCIDRLLGDNLQAQTDNVVKAERQRLFDLLEALPACVVLLSADHRVRFANCLFRERFGDPRGQRCFDHLFQRTATCEQCESYKVLETGAPHDWEWIGPDGRHYEMHDFPFVDADGSTFILKLGIDVTEQLRANEAIVQMKAELAHLDRTARLGELTSALAHEINQPLTAILSNAQAARRLLATDKPDLDAFREILDDIIRDDKRAGDIIHRLRRMLQKEKLEPEGFDVNHAVREVVQFLHGEIVGSKVAISMDLALGLPAVWAERIEIQQVIVNLLLNALHAVKDLPRDRREILIRSRPDGDAVVIAVQDRGCGIQRPDINIIFEPFFTTKPTGLGMGLAICRRMIQSHGGRIWAANNQDAGATVSFSLPSQRVGQEPGDG